MREPIRDKGRLTDILGSIDNVLKFTEGMSRDDFFKNPMCYYAVIKNLEIVGEAANLLTKEFREQHPETPWRIIIGMRNIIVHDYSNIDDNTLWNTIQNNLSPLRAQIENYIMELS